MATRILTMGGKVISWKKPPGATEMVLLEHQGRRYKGSFRTVAHFYRTNRRALKRFGVEITIFQPDWNTGVAASAGTHDFDSVWDMWINGVNPWTQQRFFRRNGWGGWTRYPPLFGWHFHGFTLPVPEGKVRSDDFAVRGFRVGVYVPGQLIDFYNHAFGLAGRHTPGSDKTWFPKDIDATIFNLPKFIEHELEKAA